MYKLQALAARPARETLHATIEKETPHSMTTDERFERIEHITAGLAEERRKDREEYKTLWRDTQRQIHELALETRLRLDQVADRFDQVGNRLDQVAATMEKQQAETTRLDERIDKLVSAIGQLIAKQ